MVAPEPRLPRRAPHRWWLFVLLACAVGAVAAGVAILGPTYRPASANGCSGPQVPGGPTPLSPIGTAWALGTPVPSVSCGKHWYNASVEAAGCGMTWGNVAIGVQTAVGTPVSPGANWSLVVTNSTGALVASYSPASLAWSGGAALLVTSGQSIDLYSAAAKLDGDGLVLTAHGSFSGTITVGIP
ncbi:MAG TPA: hypothetical protein VFF67_06370 [Thermoplasmata archaeon]|nr:hypothetical protein [Thermoplasmata archaeon]